MNSGQDLMIEVEAATREAAEAQARHHGMLVSEIVQIATPQQLDYVVRRQSRRVAEESERAEWRMLSGGEQFSVAALRILSALFIVAPCLKFIRDLAIAVSRGLTETTPEMSHALWLEYILAACALSIAAQLIRLRGTIRAANANRRA